MIQRPHCPICEKPLPDDPQQSAKVMPFCSVRCRQIDLFRWTEGRYAIVDQLDPERAALLRLEQEGQLADPEWEAE